MHEIGACTTPSDYAAARALIEEYARSIAETPCLEGLTQELATLPERYGPPSGRLLLARAGDGAVAGCVAVRRLDDASCEMKRLFVSPAARGGGLGRRLAEAALEGAAELGYELMRLDTLASMQEAQALYRSLGFRDAVPYNVASAPDVVYLERSLP
jgi:ribosomal protein S18 acetylase RimI-like enzyme